MAAHPKDRWMLRGLRISGARAGLQGDIKMKAATTIAQSFKRTSVTVYLVMSVFLNGCGSNPPDSENLPNREVPVEMGADEAADLSTAGPTPAPAATLNEAGALREKASELGNLPDELYVPYQEKWVKSKTKACNFFLITALCESGYCKTAKPFYRAADFDNYFFEKGWILITPDEMRKHLQDGTKVDMVLQRDAPLGSCCGHVAVPVGLNSAGVLQVAQGNHMQEWNEIIEYGNRYLSTFRIFARY